MEKFAQILFSIAGHPEKASNQKRAIFEKHYETVFGEQSFRLEKSDEIVKRYYEISSDYDERGKYQGSDQKIFYIFYLDGIDCCSNWSTIAKIDFFEAALREFRKDEELAPARKLIQVKFKEFLDEQLQSRT